MKTSTLIIGGLVLGVGAYLAYKYKGQIASTVNPDPTVTTLGWAENLANGIVPAGANYMGVVVYGSGFEGTFYVDDIAVAVF